uniref:Uncharacterized protein n=1 Tax=Chromera velia CCMP2878 TaxID=1169474 RepID=A0A0G4I6H2_9ALVE|eukprot:Cvel_11393.t1-p1 / transcript=Cvel_11393.t1 / gene=Cvel_11393 / organism=Chromera_velia_CCMP2878 / gene_product=Glutathionyl-hydroquinone reductase YqjG, putative / transcript_product=Glutathionyl-hydroquinone reductase YqjG, putative / location=Cvel_scaffold715:3428-11768(-) / protein_length=1152 / sequence_SO=supercontig / SO=protein_coding / is_pseudo=false
MRYCLSMLFVVLFAVLLVWPASSFTRLPPTHALAGRRGRAAVLRVEKGAVVVEKEIVSEDAVVPGEETPLIEEETAIEETMVEETASSSAGNVSASSVPHKKPEPKGNGPFEFNFMEWLSGKEKNVPPAAEKKTATRPPAQAEAEEDKRISLSQEEEEEERAAKTNQKSSSGNETAVEVKEITSLTEGAGVEEDKQDTGSIAKETEVETNSMAFSGTEKKSAPTAKAVGEKPKPNSTGGFDFLDWLSGKEAGTKTEAPSGVVLKEGKEKEKERGKEKGGGISSDGEKEEETGDGEGQVGEGMGASRAAKDEGGEEEKKKVPPKKDQEDLGVETKATQPPVEPSLEKDQRVKEKKNDWGFFSDMFAIETPKTVGPGEGVEEKEPTAGTIGDYRDRKMTARGEEVKQGDEEKDTLGGERTTQVDAAEEIENAKESETLETTQTQTPKPEKSKKRQQKSGGGFELFELLSGTSRSPPAVKKDAKKGAERKAEEQAERKVAEEVQKGEQEAAEKAAVQGEEEKGQDQSEKMTKEEALRKVKEAVEKEAKEEAAKKAKQEAQRKAKEESLRKVREEAQKKAKEEAERKAQQEAERKAKQEADRKAKEEAAKKAKEEAEKTARQIKEKEEAQRKSREQAESKKRMVQKEQQKDQTTFVAPPPTSASPAKKAKARADGGFELLLTRKAKKNEGEFIGAVDVGDKRTPDSSNESQKPKDTEEKKQKPVGEGIGMQTGGGASQSVKDQKIRQKTDGGLRILEWAGAVVPQGAVVSVARTGWREAWKQMLKELAPQSAEGEYIRPSYGIRGDADLSRGGFHLYLGHACPWCHRVALSLALQGLYSESLKVDGEGKGRGEGKSPVTVSYMTDDPERASRGGWAFTDTAGDGEEGEAELGHLKGSPDPLFGARDLRQVYDRCSDGGRFRGRCTAPLLVDSETGTIVSNESEDIVKMIDRLGGGSLFGGVDSEGLEEIYTKINNGVYRCGFSTSQEAYRRAHSDVFEGLARVDGLLSSSRYLPRQGWGGAGAKGTSNSNSKGSQQPSALDVWLFPTVVRFDGVYSSLFKCGGKKIKSDFPHVLAWAQDLWEKEEVRRTFEVDLAIQSYFRNLFPLNPSGIIPNGPSLEDIGLWREQGSQERRMAGREAAKRKTLGKKKVQKNMFF